MEALRRAIRPIQRGSSDGLEQSSEVLKPTLGGISQQGEKVSTRGILLSMPILHSTDGQIPSPFTWCHIQNQTRQLRDLLHDGRTRRHWISRHRLTGVM